MAKITVGIIGVGAFGTLMAKHLAPHAALVLHDAAKDVSGYAADLGARAGTLADAAACEIVIFAVPVQKLEAVLHAVAPMLKPKTLCIDVASVKVKAVALMEKILPAHVDIVATHPIFGPQSGKNGIEGLKLAVCPVRGERADCIVNFCRDTLKLDVYVVTPEEHDREMAYVQGITHLLAKIVVRMDVPPLRLTTKTFNFMEQMVDMVRYDSDELFRAIQRENPFAKPTETAFFEAAAKLEKDLDGIA
ncbi:MAG: prephenate dehydrogenase [Alphaproteobacteria bacterium]|nr:prephenate dehydrogenase [Alphaproteobacteria bacterium]